MEEKYGDDKFRDFMNREYNKNDPLIIIIEALRCKINAISEIYAKSLDAYTSLKIDDPLRETLIVHIKKMMEHTIQTMEQFNLALIDDTDDLEDEEGIE